MMYTFGFIGTGNMGGALAKAAAKSTKNILLADHFAEKAEALAQQLGCDCADNIAVVRSCRYVFLGVKPQMMADMLTSVRDALCCRDDIILVTMAAGLRIATIRELAGHDFKTIRIMPNTPVEVGEGEILYTPSENVTQAELDEFLSLMQYAGQLTAIPESLMDAGCSLSGCGPAFVFKFIRALAQGGVNAGIDEKTAIALAAQTVVGAAKLLTASPLDPETLIKNVCSPGGSTIEGVKSLDADNFEGAVEKAVAASYKRNQELGKA
ncbi:MAG: pyrroline-5-carboxylate reductase [Ruminococcus sp.]|nr:pyrroline-5-carboxylate reductase [Ruminococcus sp.]